MRLTVGRGKDRVGFRLYERGKVEHRAATPDELRWQPERKTVRAYVVAADVSPAAQGEDYAGWRAWALAKADALDPLKDASAPFKRLVPIDAWSWRRW